MIPAMTAYDAASRAGVPTGRITDEQWSVVKGAMGGGAGKPKRAVAVLSKEYEVLEVYDSVADAARGLGVSHQYASSICGKSNRTCKGYRLKYVGVDFV